MVVATVVIIVVLLILSFAIEIAVKRRRKFKQFLGERLVDHVGDNLNARYYNDDISSYNTDIYIYSQLIAYATKTALRLVPRRQQYTKDGEYTQRAAEAIMSAQQNIFDAFTDDCICLTSNYAEFIRDYRLDYLVSDFNKSIPEYLEFRVSPGLYRKAADIMAEKAAKEKAEKVPDETSVVSDTASNMTDTTPIPDFDDDEVIEETMPFSSTVTIDRDITDALTCYARKLAKKKCGKAEADAKSEKYETEVRNSYNKLSKIFFDNRRFKQSFVDWANGQYPDYGMTKFETLIPMYIRYIKQK
jgi:hypothetical protein